MIRDEARRLTDKELERLEHGIHAAYKAAYDEMRSKWDNYMASFKEREQGYLRRLDEALRSGNGREIGAAKRAYRKFVSDHTIQSKEYARMRDQLAAKLANVDKAVNELVNGKLPSIYALNFNYLAGQLPKAYAYGLINPKTVQNLMLKELKLVKAEWWNKKLMNQQVLQGILQGESMDKIAKRFKNVLNMNEVSAMRNARTSVTYAENKGRFDSMKAAQDNGTILKKVWYATDDGLTRDSHQITGEERDLDEVFSNGCEEPGDPGAPPEEVYNCRCALGTRIIGFKKADGSIVYV